MVDEPHEMTLKLAARGENLRRVRDAVARLAQQLGAANGDVARIKVAVNEACSNVIRHAYRGGQGELRVAARPAENDLVVVVEDCGHGIDSDTNDPGGGFGLALVEAFADDVDIRLKSERGTTVEMRFRLARAA